MKIIIIFLILISVLVVGCEQQQVDCMVDSDCVAATCCHADSCVAKENALDCEGSYCSMECKPYTMDCGQGSCVCENNKCAVKFA